MIKYSKRKSYCAVDQRIDINLGANGWVSGELCALTFNKAYPSIPNIVFPPVETLIGQIFNVNAPNLLISKTGFSLRCFPALIAGGVLKFCYIVIE